MLFGISRRLIVLKVFGFQNSGPNIKRPAGRVYTSTPGASAAATAAAAAAVSAAI